MAAGMDAGVVYIGLGSNLGDRASRLAAARDALARAGGRLEAVSSLYLTDPLDVVDQPDYLNQVVAWKTPRTPDEILDVCLETERAMGRVRTRPRGPRVIDLDLLLAGDAVMRRAGLEVPHPRLHLRRFVLVPLAEIAPGVRHPILGRTIEELLACCPDRSRVERIDGTGAGRCSAPERRL